MKAQILKIAGVKSEAAFYKLFPTESDFLKAHGAEFKKAQRGEKIKKADEGYQINGRNYISNLLTQEQVMGGPSSAGLMKQPQLAKVNPQQPTQAGMNAFNKIVGKGSNVGGYVQAGADVVQGLSMIKGQNDKVKKAKQDSLVSGVLADAAESRDIEANNQPNLLQRAFYNNINTGNEFFPTYGVGSNVLAKDGKKIPNAANGINTFLNSGTFGNIMNQGGGDLLGKIGNMVTNKGKGDDAGSMIGGGLGSAAGTLIGGPIGGMVGKFAGKIIGGAIDRSDIKEEKYNDISGRNVNRAMGQNFAGNIFAQNNKYMEDGGNVNPQIISEFGGHKLSDLLKRDKMMDTLRTGGQLSQNNIDDLQLYEGGTQQVSPDMIRFNGPSHADGGINIAYGGNPVEVEGGEYATEVPDDNGQKSLVVLGNLKNPLTGHKFKRDGAILAKHQAKEDRKLKSYTMKAADINVNTPFEKITLDTLKLMTDSSKKKLQKFDDEKNDYIAMQEAINKTAEENGLDADALSKGNIKRAKNGGKFTAQDGKTIEDRMKMVLGPSTFGLNKSTNPSSPTYMYPYNDPRVPLGTLSPENSIYNLTRPILQGINETINSNIDPLRGKFEYGPESERIENIGAPKTINKISAIDTRPTSSKKSITKELLTNLVDLAKWKAERDAWEQEADPMDAQRIANSRNNIVSKIVETTKSSTDTTNEKEKFPWMEMLNSIVPYLRPSDAEPLDPRQILGEMSAMSEKEEPVQAQLYKPQLGTPYDISLQDQMNDVISQTRAAQRMSGYNPAAQAIIASQAYEPLNKIRGEEMRINQAMKDKVYGENRNTLNDATLKNLQILDNQYTRQSQAKSNTKAVLRAALDSISSKYLQNQLENRKLATYENLYNYRFDDKFRKQNLNPLMEWNMEGNDMSGNSLAGLSDDFIPRYETDPETGKLSVVDLRRKTSAEKKTGVAKGRNGGLVKAIHSL